MDPVPDPLLLRKSAAPGIEPGTSVSAAMKSDHWTTEAVFVNTHSFLKCQMFLTDTQFVFFNVEMKLEFFYMNSSLKF
jgi:hypothetical protein